MRCSSSVYRIMREDHLLCVRKRTFMACSKILGSPSGSRSNSDARLFNALNHTQWSEDSPEGER
jgi:hypothetical protein